jgi:hypothetical protein
MTVLPCHELLDQTSASIADGSLRVKRGLFDVRLLDEFFDPVLRVLVIDAHCQTLVARNLILEISALFAHALNRSWIRRER